MRFTARIGTAALAAGAVLALAVACSDNSAGTAPSITRDSQGRIVMGECTTIAHLDSMATKVFGANSASLSTVRGKLQNLAAKVDVYDVAASQAQAKDIVNYVKQQVTVGGLPGTEAEINEFISGVSCYAGLTPDTWLVLPSAVPTVHTTNDGNSGILLEGGTITTPTVLTITPIDSTEPSPLDTKLDQYPIHVRITSSSALTKPAVVALCPSVAVPAGVRARLRVGHQAASGFEITPKADGSFLACENSLAHARAPKFLRALARLVLPTKVYAASFEVSGIGGSATEFSPFGVVDPEASFSGGVGGSSTEFIRQGAAVGERSSVVSGGVCTQVSATVGTQLEPECRPTITLTTPNGTVLTSVPIAWSVAAGGGTIAPNIVASQTCGAFSGSAQTTTNAQGKAGVCWTLGPSGGVNGVIATPSAGGDVPPGTIFNPPAMSFAATGLPIVPDASAQGGTFVFDATPHAGSGSCTNGLTPTLAYSSGTAPIAVGVHTLTVTCGAGNGSFTPSTASAEIAILAAAPTVNITCPATVVYTAVPQLPCSGTAVAPGLNLSPNVTYADNLNAGTATATVSLPSGGNYSAVNQSKTFVITAAPTSTSVACAGAPFTYTGALITPCVSKTTGAGGLNVSPPVAYTANVNAGTANASAEFGGMDNYLASIGTATFLISKAPTTTTVTCPPSVPYTGAAQQPCNAHVAGPGELAASLTPSYSNNINVGTASASAAYSGASNYLASNNTTTFAIGTFGITATAGSATVTLGAAVPAIPCVVTGLLAGESGAVTCTTSVPSYSAAGTYATTPVLSPANPANYSVTLVPGVLTVNVASQPGPYHQEDCFQSPLDDWFPDWVQKGSVIPVKCKLEIRHHDDPVTNAKGDLTVYDRGFSGFTNAGTVFTGTNVFTQSSPGRYVYNLDTSPSGFVVGHYYMVVASWDDGSTTTGWFRVK